MVWNITCCITTTYRKSGIYFGYLNFRILLCINHLCFTVTFSISHSHEMAKVNQLFLNNLQKNQVPHFGNQMPHSESLALFWGTWFFIYTCILTTYISLQSIHNHRHSNPQNITICHSTAYRKSGMLSMYLFFHIYLCINLLHLTAIYSAYRFP